MTTDLPPIDPELARVLREEARGLAEVLRDVLLAEAPSDSITGVYLKGSSVRAWDSRIDYVPEISDVDVHVRVRPEARAHTDSLDFALRVAGRTEAVFLDRFPSPRHTPRPQLFFLHDMERSTGYLPSTRDSVVVLHGADYSFGTFEQYEACRADDEARFLIDADFVRDSLAGKIIDRPGSLSWQAVATLTWRVAPTGPRLLTALGHEPWAAWSMNRTDIVAALLDAGAEEVARSYRDFYLAAWDGYSTGFRDSGPALKAIQATHRLFAGGRDVLTRDHDRASALSVGA